MNDLDLVDAWRIFNPTLHQFTWRQANIKCRLDFFLTSTALLNNIKKVEHSYGFRTDHSYITLEMNTNMIKRGPGFFKLNTSLLIDTKYTTIIKMLIRDKKAEYAQQNLAPDLKWETVKSDIRGESIKYSKIKAKKLKAKTQEIENKLHELEQVRDALNHNRIDKTIDELKTKLSELIKERTNGILIRAKSRWMKDGEKNTRYFMNLEKRNYLNKTILTFYNTDILEAISDY